MTNYRTELLNLLGALDNYIRRGPDGFEDLLCDAANDARRILEEDAPSCVCGRACKLVFSEDAIWECPVCPDYIEGDHHV